MQNKSGLTQYKRKRNFKITKEPAGTVGRSKGYSYLIQKHAASHLHYDLRLELNGVLKSWAVPKGPSYDPADKRLAMQVEDHPVEYGTFEGIIPKGQYGGGTVMLWDTGTWVPVGDPEEGLSKGKLVFQLRGKRLQGEWTLVRAFTRDKSGHSWLLIKHKDEFVKVGNNAAFLEKNNTSILSKRKMEAIQKAGDHVWQSKGAKTVSARSPKATNTRKAVSVRSSVKKAVLPAFSKPQLATLADAMPKTPEWVHEIKFDGYRIVAHINAGVVKLFSRNGNDWTEKFSSITEFLSRFRGSAILDGEVVVPGEGGVSNFSALKEALTAGDVDQLQYYAFDLLFLNGQDTRQLTLLERKELLKRLIRDHKTAANAHRIIYSEHYERQTDTFLETACSLHLEGVMSKRADASYVSGRTKTWLKTKCHKRQEFVIGGFTLSKVGGTGIGSLLLGYYRDKDLIYAGRVGTGFTAESSRTMRKAVEKLRRTKMAYKAVPAEARRGAIWLEPTLVCEVEFGEWTPDGHLRHPSFQGMREDKKAKSVIKEVPVAASAAISDAESEVESEMRPLKAKKSKAALGMMPHKAKAPVKISREKGEVAGVDISHASRLIFPDTGITKLKLAEYYLSVSDYMMPYIQNRPLSVLRCPEGAGKECFFQRHIGLGKNPDIHEVGVGVKGQERKYLSINHKRGLIALVQWGGIEFHPWQCTDKKLDKPDQIIFDLDPDPAVTWKELIDGAKVVRERLQQIGLDPYLKTTGGKGLHLVVPLVPLYEWTAIKSFTHAIARTVASEAPDRFIATMSKAARKGKIFIDYLRNDVTSTAVAPYSVRARDGAAVATPIEWSELKDQLVPLNFTVDTVPARLKKLKKDPWKDFTRNRQKIPKNFIGKA